MLRLTTPNYLKIIILPVQVYPAHVPEVPQVIVPVLPLAVYPGVQVTSAELETVVVPVFRCMEAAFVIEGMLQSIAKNKQKFRAKD